MVEDMSVAPVRRESLIIYLRLEIKEQEKDIEGRGKREKGFDI